MNGLLVTMSGFNLMSTGVWQVLVTPVVYVLSLVVYVFVGKIGLIEIGGSHVLRLDRIRTRRQDTS